LEVLADVVQDVAAADQKQHVDDDQRQRQRP
jgi:hypothetical protein